MATQDPSRDRVTVTLDREQWDALSDWAVFMLERGDDIPAEAESGN